MEMASFMFGENRLSQEDWLWSLAFRTASRSTCSRAKHGCVVSDDGIVLTTGFNGSADGEPHCIDVGCEMIDTLRQTTSGIYKREEHCVRTIHAEMNCIINAALLGTKLRGADWHVTGVPCPACAKAIIRLKPTRIFVCSDRGNTEMLDWLRKKLYQDLKEVPYEEIERKIS